MDNKRRPIKTNRVLWFLGLLSALSGAFLIWNGCLLGEETASLGRTIGILGIIAIGTATARM